MHDMFIFQIKPSMDNIYNLFNPIAFTFRVTIDAIDMGLRKMVWEKEIKVGANC